jgi:hypothetical protein
MAVVSTNAGKQNTGQNKVNLICSVDISQLTVNISQLTGNNSQPAENINTLGQRHHNLDLH